MKIQKILIIVGILLVFSLLVFAGCKDEGEKKDTNTETSVGGAVGTGSGSAEKSCLGKAKACRHLHISECLAQQGCWLDNKDNCIEKDHSGGLVQCGDIGIESGCGQEDTPQYGCYWG